MNFFVNNFLKNNERRLKFTSKVTDSHDFDNICQSQGNWRIIPYSKYLIKLILRKQLFLKLECLNFS